MIVVTVFLLILNQMEFHLVHFQKENCLNGILFDSCSNGKPSQRSYPFQIEKIMIVVTVFLLIMKPTEFRLIHIQTDNRQNGHIPLNLKGIRNVFLGV